ncbi:MAG: hypothetical protein QXD77_03025 [Candidatus Aenigmatarchaeota archaeon]
MSSKFRRKWKGAYRNREYETPLSTARFVPEQYDLVANLKHIGYVQGR